MSTPMYEKVSQQEALAQIESILDALQLSESELDELGEQYLLTEREYGLWRRVVELRWLSGVPA
ncbi:hypothetical protein [Corynebacterium sp.]|uniref:hypothetical protein n=1 Tax=Corynebacterium sp. TaxID=1720 RepID=UPI0026DFF398|nr:hypothetical protein [Corynebacterium sp.]MDO5512887.1 hypothetical protein [Corynebacterium sp.]